KGINLAEGDEVVGMVVADPQGYLLTVCENGYGKRTPFGANIAGAEPPEEEEEGSGVRSQGSEEADEAGEELDEAAAVERGQMRYRKQRRGGKGVHDIRTTERNGPVVGVLSVRDGDDIVLITTQGMVNRTHIDEIRVVGRNTQGVRIMNLGEDDKIASIAKVAKENGEVASAEDQPDNPATEPTPQE